jgi:ribokinase
MQHSPSSSLHQLTTIVVGGLNTDIIGQGVPVLVGPGELSLGGTLKLGPGGKSRNIAQMIAMLQGPGRVAMIGKTAQDPWGLWRIPLDALIQAKVDTSLITVLPLEARQFPGVALIPVDQSGQNQIYVLPGANADFAPADLDAAESVFHAAAANHGSLVASLECPFPTVLHAIRLAKQNHLTTYVDPGGIDPVQNYQLLLAMNLDLIKPNEHEASLLTGLTVRDPLTALMAAQKLRQLGSQAVLLTLGAQGAVLVSPEGEWHLPAPIPPASLAACDATGCGDQTLATLIYARHRGMPLPDAVRLALHAGTLQFSRLGIQPLSPADLAMKLPYSPS